MREGSAKNPMALRYSGRPSTSLKGYGKCSPI
jgi:hypothetical protein